MSFLNARSLVADYSSSSEDESESNADSVDSDSDSSETDLAIDSSEDECKLDEIIKPVEELKLSIPSTEALVAGKIKSIVDEQVIVEPNPGMAALDLNSVLFLDKGERALGRIDDVFGPVTEPLYSVYFNSIAEIEKKGIKTDMVVYYAPNTDHTNFVLIKELMRMKGSDASWSQNREPPPEFQDFSDDEEERAVLGNKNQEEPRTTPYKLWYLKKQRSPRSSPLPRRRSESFSPQRRLSGPPESHNSNQQPSHSMAPCGPMIFGNMYNAPFSSPGNVHMLPPPPPPPQQQRPYYIPPTHCQQFSSPPPPLPSNIIYNPMFQVPPMSPGSYAPQNITNFPPRYDSPSMASSFCSPPTMVHMGNSFPSYGHMTIPNANGSFPPSPSLNPSNGPHTPTRPM